MRQIKLRAWLTSYKKMTDEFSIGSQGKISATGSAWVFSEPEPIIMQYTGFLDKNGKEIYFDDIVKFSFNDPENGSYRGTAVVTNTISEGVGLLFDRRTGSNETWAVTSGGQVEDIWHDENIWYIEVIGNIHENPDLLEIPKLVIVSPDQFHELHTTLPDYDGKFTPGGLGTKRIPLYDHCPICGKETL